MVLTNKNNDNSSSILEKVDRDSCRWHWTLRTLLKILLMTVLTLVIIGLWALLTKLDSWLLHPFWSLMNCLVDWSQVLQVLVLVRIKRSRGCCNVLLSVALGSWPSKYCVARDLPAWRTRCHCQAENGHVFSPFQSSKTCCVWSRVKRYCNPQS